MILEVTYSDGHHECFDSNSLTGGAVFGRANILTGERSFTTMDVRR